MPTGYIYPKAECGLCDLLRKRIQLVQDRSRHLIRFKSQVQMHAGQSLRADPIKARYLVIQAVLMALWQRNDLSAVILYSDRGCQFSEIFIFLFWRHMIGLTQPFIACLLQIINQLPARDALLTQPYFQSIQVAPLPPLITRVVHACPLPIDQ